MTAADWLDAWDHCRTLPPTLRACYLLDRALGLAEGATAALPLGQRDGQLLELQQALFGPQIAALAQCPHCGERLELNLRIDELRVPAATASADTRVSVNAQGYQLSCRLPNSHDFTAAASAQHADDARALLLQRCLLLVRCDGADVAVSDVPSSVTAQLSQALEDADPQANTELAMQCPACAWQWTEPLDIALHLLACLAHWAARCLDQVHTLAQAYGWSEQQILALSPARRAHYLEKVLA